MCGSKHSWSKSMVILHQQWSFMRVVYEKKNKNQLTYRLCQWYIYSERLITQSLFGLDELPLRITKPSMHNVMLVLNFFGYFVPLNNLAIIFQGKILQLMTRLSYQLIFQSIFQNPNPLRIYILYPLLNFLRHCNFCIYECFIVRSDRRIQRIHRARCSSSLKKIQLMCLCYNAVQEQC